MIQSGMANEMGNWKSLLTSKEPQRAENHERGKAFRSCFDPQTRIQSVTVDFGSGKIDSGATYTLTHTRRRFLKSNLQLNSIQIHWITIEQWNSISSFQLICIPSSAYYIRVHSVALLQRKYWFIDSLIHWLGWTQEKCTGSHRKTAQYRSGAASRPQPIIDICMLMSFRWHEFKSSRKVIISFFFFQVD